MLYVAIMNLFWPTEFKHTLQNLILLMKKKIKQNSDWFRDCYLTSKIPPTAIKEILSQRLSYPLTVKVKLTCKSSWKQDSTKLQIKH